MYSIYIYLPVPDPEAQVRYIRYAGRAHLRMDTLILSTYILTYVSTFEGSSQRSGFLAVR